MKGDFMKSVSICFALVCAAAGSSALQTDWSAGPSGSEPVSEWSDTFSQCQGVSWFALPGEVSLSSDPLAVCQIEDIAPSIPTSGLACCDVNGDGTVDVAGASLVNGHFWWFENSGSGVWESHALPGEFDGALGCSFFDVDGDGYRDLLGASAEPDQVVVWYNSSGSGEFGNPVVISPSFPGAHCAVGCYADEDTVADIMGAGNQCSEIAVWFGLGNDQWEKVVIASGFAGTQSVSPGDIDGDGDPDAVGAALTAGEFAWWENPGNRTDPWIKHTVADSMTSAHHTVAVDINSDGYTDILGASFGNGKITWWENDGVSQSVWEPHTVAPGLTGVLTAIPGDFDGDNDLDVAGTSWSLDRVVWYENLDGTGENWQTRTAKTGFNGAWPLASGDFDGNGRIELVAGADVLNGPGTSHGVSIVELCSFTETGWLESCILDTEENPQWASFQFDAFVPAGCSLEFYWKSSGNPENLGDWSEPFTGFSDLSGLIHRYVQYRIEIACTGGLDSPVLRDVQLNWDPLGIQEATGTGFLLDPVTSPASGGITVCLSDKAGISSISVFSLSGRVLRLYRDCNPGDNVHVENLCPGLYLIKAECGSAVQVERVCLIR